MTDIDRLIERVELHLSLSANDETLLRKELPKMYVDHLDDWDLAELADTIIEAHTKEL